MLTCFERESIVIGSTLLFESEAAKWIWPALTADKFIFSKTGAMGSKDHTHVWSAIELCLGQKKSPNITNVMAIMNEKHGWTHAELTSYVDRVKGYYRIHTLDPKALMDLAEEVDKAGVAYQTMAFSSPFAKLLESPQDFQNYVDNQIQDVDLWLNEFTGQFRSVVRNGTEGYESTLDIAVRARQEIEQIRSGEVSMLLPIGLPSHRLNALYPYGSMVVVQGGSNMGKSAYANLIILGTAIGLQKQNISGCVAVNSLENSATSMVKKLAAILAGFNTQKLYQEPSSLRGEDVDRYMEWIDYVGRLPIRIDTTDMLKTTVMQYRLQGIHSSEYGPLRLLVSDYSELFGDDEGETKEQNLALVSRRHLSIARVLNAVVMLLWQGGIPENKYRLSGAYGLRGSQGGRHATDFQMEIYNPIELKRKGIDYVLPEGLDDDHVWGLFSKTRDIATPEPIAFNWTPEYTRLSDPNLDFGHVNGGPLFEHFMEIEEIQKVTKSIVPAVADTSLGEHDWSFGLSGGAF